MLSIRTDTRKAGGVAGGEVSVDVAGRRRHLLFFRSTLGFTNRLNEVDNPNSQFPLPIIRLEGIY